MTSVGSVGIGLVEDTTAMEVDIVGQEDATYLERGMGAVGIGQHLTTINCSLILLGYWRLSVGKLLVIATQLFTFPTIMLRLKQSRKPFVDDISFGRQLIPIDSISLTWSDFGFLSTNGDWRISRDCRSWVELARSPWARWKKSNWRGFVSEQWSWQRFHGNLSQAWSHHVASPWRILQESDSCSQRSNLGSTDEFRLHLHHPRSPRQRAERIHGRIESGKEAKKKSQENGRRRDCCRCSWARCLNALTCFVGRILLSFGAFDVVVGVRQRKKCFWMFF